MRFKANADTVPVTFVDTNLQMYLDDDAQTPVNFNMKIGWIDPFYQNASYFDNFKENVLGLSPMLLNPDDE